MNKYKWPLMADAIGAEERAALVDFINTTDRFTNGPEVKRFEEQWSEWQGCKYSVMVNSGASANLVILSTLPPKSRVATPACTWATNVSSIIQLGHTPVFYDIDRKTYGPTEDSLKELSRQGVDAILITHLMGLANNMDLINQYLPDVVIFEDCCESHGATFKGTKVGNFGMASSFSFYFGHHMTTIEGGMICTNDRDVYNALRARRSHGMSREMEPEYRDAVAEENPDIDPRFLFPVDGFNCRSTEINAVLGQVQLKKLDHFIRIRQQNYYEFIKLVNKFREHLYQPNHLGNSSMTLPFHCKSAEACEKLKQALEDAGIETRPFLVGNLLEQPFIKRLGYEANLPITEEIHRQSLYIGNSQFVTEQDVRSLEEVLKSVF
jgi:CDP-4-dehydro-6-deoxyglucose reductase, E1